tara:strand:- start:4799 stop:5074 length:276 start_codon:yes stop_codon:yes gene_type:complete
MKPRNQIIKEAADLINGDRADRYGDCLENFENIAAGWSVILGVTVTPGQVALALDWMKTCRIVQTPDHKDSWVDKLGYLALGWECIERAKK